MAYAVLRGRLTDEELYNNNVNGSLSVFRTAGSLGIKKVINMSSASVYGAGEDIEENASLRPAAGFIYAQHKAKIEELCASRYSNVVHLRAHLIFGRHAQPFLRSMASAPVVIKPVDPQPLIQVVHEADVVQAILKSLLSPICSGAFNLAAPQKVSLLELVKYRRKRVIPVPLTLARSVARLTNRFGSKDELTWLEVLDTSLTMNCAKASAVLGWKPQFSAWQAREEMKTLSD
jgi:nucleoside-diphosphate-sugar epimerase